MTESKLPEWLVGLQESFGLTSVRAKEDLVLYFMSAYDRYEELKPSYVSRNISFLADSIFITLSHATRPSSNPSGFGLALGSFLGFVSKASDAQVAKFMFSNNQTLEFMKKCVLLFKGIQNFDMNIVKDKLKEINISRLDSSELAAFNSLLEMA